MQKKTQFCVDYMNTVTGMYKYKQCFFKGLNTRERKINERKKNLLFQGVSPVVCEVNKTLKCCVTEYFCGIIKPDPLP
jgi:hypothetical protein